MKYRGKHAIDDYRWSYGDIFYGLRNTNAYIIGQSFSGGEYISVEVVPETVTDCIDYVDVNGVDIYKGDIIKILNYDGYPSKSKHEEFYIVGTKRGFLNQLRQSRFSRVEVVGNKWDNPYLLEMCKEVI